jgi:hypothetical protein
MGKGGYHGGSTIIYPGSSWFSGHTKKKSKDKPASRADLKAGNRIRAALEADRRSNPSKAQTTNADLPSPSGPRLLKKETQRLAHLSRVSEAEKKKAKKRATHQAQMKIALEKKKAKNARRLQLEAERKSDPEYQAKLAARHAARAPKWMSSVIVERRSKSGKLVLQTGLFRPAKPAPTPTDSKGTKQ